MKTPTLDTAAGEPVIIAEQRDRFLQNRINERGRRMLWRFGALGWFVIDSALAGGSVFAAYWLSPFTQYLEPDNRHAPLWLAMVGYAILVGVISNIAGLQDPRHPRQLWMILMRVCGVVVAATVLLMLELTVVHYVTLGRYVLVAMTAFTFSAIGLSRILVWIHFSSSLAPSICLLGEDRFCFQAARFLEEHPLPFRARTISDVDDIGQVDSLSRWAVEHGIDEIVYDPSSELASDDALLRCLDHGINIRSYPDFVEANYCLVPVQRIDAKWLFSSRLDLAHPYYHGVKRFIDVFFGVLGLLLSAPLVAIAFVLIKLESHGPVFYSQIRVGQFNRNFRIYKLRTMVQNAEQGGAAWAKTGDSRVTRIGRILRKTRLDEVPQFWNIICGDMSLVGPRPERPEFVSMLRTKIPFYVQRHLVKPGLTGWAQINYPYGASVEDAMHKLTYDLYYVKRASLWLDVQILLRTVGAIMKGAR
ncbi:MAG: sugar transferase [Pirellulaceae bacterium]|nr:sugar transferase [Planctomycetales bacterium]